MAYVRKGSKAPGRPSGGKRLGAGRKPGVPNKVTVDVRQAIAAFAENNAPKFVRWVEQVALGKQGRRVVVGVKGRVVVVGERDPDPGRAAEIYLRAIEYHI